MTMTDAEVAAIEKLLCPPTVACLECPPFHRLIAEIRRLRAVETAARLLIGNGALRDLRNALDGTERTANDRAP